MSKFQSNLKPYELLTSEAFCDRLNQYGYVIDAEISEPLIIDHHNHEFFELVNCNFGEIEIKTKLENLSIRNCRFSKLLISEDIKEISISNNECKKASVNIYSTNIDKLYFHHNLSIEELIVGFADPVNIRNFYCHTSEINHVIFSINCELLELASSNRISNLTIGTNIDKIRFSSLNLKDSFNSIYGKVFVYNHEVNCKIYVSDSKFSHLHLSGYKEPLLMDIKRTQGDVLEIYETNFHPKGKVIIKEQTCFNKMLITSCDLKYLNLFNLTLEKTFIAINQSIISEINWQFVKWSRKIDFYFSDKHNEYHNLETIRILKLNSIRQEDKFHSVLFSSLENEAYRKLNRHEKLNTDSVILWLNKISNNHGLDPWRGVSFTLIVGAIFFCPNLFLLKNPFWEWGWTNIHDYSLVIGEMLELYAKSIYAAHDMDYLKEFEPRGLVYLIDMIGRIFVAYGYYQTVSAFRKFSKK